MIYKCELCHKSYNRTPAAQARAKRHYCSGDCWAKVQTGKIRVSDKDYKWLYRKININGQVVSLHRVIAENKIGRKLRQGEVVHHIDGNKKNNSPDNLQIIPSQSEHVRLELSHDIIVIDKIKLKELWEQGKSTGEISSIFDCSRDVIRRRLKRIGILNWKYRKRTTSHIS